MATSVVKVAEDNNRIFIKRDDIVDDRKDDSGRLDVVRQETVQQ